MTKKKKKNKIYFERKRINRRTFVGMRPVFMESGKRNEKYKIDYLKEEY